MRSEFERLAAAAKTQIPLDETLWTYVRIIRSTDRIVTGCMSDGFRTRLPTGPVEVTAEKTRGYGMLGIYRTTTGSLLYLGHGHTTWGIGNGNGKGKMERKGEGKGKARANS